MAVLSKDGRAYGGIITVGTAYNDYELGFEDLKPVKMVNLPRPYPRFLPYYFVSGQEESFDPSASEVLQLSIGPGLEGSELQQPHGISIESIRIE